MNIPRTKAILKYLDFIIIPGEGENDLVRTCTCHLKINLNVNFWFIPLKFKFILFCLFFCFSKRFVCRLDQLTSWGLDWLWRILFRRLKINNICNTNNNRIITKWTIITTASTPTARIVAVQCIRCNSNNHTVLSTAWNVPCPVWHTIIIDVLSSISNNNNGIIEATTARARPVVALRPAIVSPITLEFLFFVFCFMFCFFFFWLWKKQLKQNDYTFKLCMFPCETFKKRNQSSTNLSSPTSLKQKTLTSTNNNKHCLESLARCELMWYI